MGDRSPVDDAGVFAERVLRQPLWPHQVEAARAGAFITAIAAARRTGKTTLIETLAAWTCFREPGVRAVILSAGLDSARRVTESIAATLAASPLTRGSVVDDFATRIRLSNGSEIVSLPASQRQVRGYGRGVKLLVIDEAGFVPEELWRAAHYVALDERGSGARIVLAGTPWGGPDMFFRRAFDAGRDGDPDHASFHWTHEANPRLDHAYLERQRDRVSPAEYAAEVLGEWSDAAGSLFPRSLLDRQTADLVLPDLRGLAGPAAGLLGVDWGVSFDRSAVAAVYRLPCQVLNPGSERLPRFVVVPRVWPAGRALSDVVGEIAAVRAPWRAVSTEVSGVGAMPSQELRRAMPGRARVRAWNLVATTNAKKTAGYGAILGLLERGQLVLPRDPDLLRQLAGLRFEQGERGFTRIEAEDRAVHDDVADALMLAAAPYAPAGTRGRIRCYLADVADPKAAPADVEGPWSDGPADELDTVVTGGGLRVLRRPALQSAAGVEVLRPAAAPGWRRPVPGHVRRLERPVWVRNRETGGLFEVDRAADLESVRGRAGRDGDPLFDEFESFEAAQRGRKEVIA
ncbi:MAG: terminase family protein [Solirubrobacteraceae bacterium]